tara:strand:- start:229 stop:885 length:657 start_codon:yes stop_codon:yes gene_type:complete
MKFLKSSGLLVIISSPSGAGKSSLARELVDSDPNLSFSVSFTTREKRRGELDGKDYFFVDISTFKNLSEKGDMLEYAKVFGNYYGTPKAPIELGLMEGKDFVFDVDWQGGDQIRSSDFSENVVSIFILPPSISELENRLLGRRQDSKKIVSNRMAEAKSEIEHWKEYDYVLVNNEFHKTLDEIRAIVKASRLTLCRNSSLESFVGGLNCEFEERKNKV